MARKIMPRRKDKKTFRRTAAKSKKININPKIMRGGIRL
ncbi:DNA binding protein [Sigmofec virus UA08Rod_5712]|uniref:DNA binding protein n=1 Tax=Sigmofec virus UA08Rod_5712 TaxID=2929438 RepID=A0A976N1G2_9VIRU|nr:DNA binding protein [Sigmofec virus UA08Rod_5712]